LFKTSVYLFGISWSLYCLSSYLRLLFISLVSLGHCIVCPLVYDFCLSLGHCIVCPLVYDFCLFLGHCIVLSSGLRLLFTSLVSLGHCIVCPLIYDFCLQTIQRPRNTKEVKQKTYTRGQDKTMTKG
jgi:hypothetical protein